MLDHKTFKSSRQNFPCTYSNTTSHCSTNKTKQSLLGSPLASKTSLPKTKMMEWSQEQHLTQSCVDPDDLGFDFEESNQVITNFQDLPVQYELSDESSDTSSSVDSLSSFDYLQQQGVGEQEYDEEHQTEEHQEEYYLQEEYHPKQNKTQSNPNFKSKCAYNPLQPIQGEGSTCSTAESLSEDEESVSSSSSSSSCSSSCSSSS
jgi:hypothetical protein